MLHLPICVFWSWLCVSLLAPCTGVSCFQLPSDCPCVITLPCIYIYVCYLCQSLSVVVLMLREYPCLALILFDEVLVTCRCLLAFGSTPYTHLDRYTLSMICTQQYSLLIINHFLLYLRNYLYLFTTFYISHSVFFPLHHLINKQ